MGCGRRGTGNEGVKEVKVGRAHWQFGTTIIAAHTRLHSPPLSRQPTSQPTSQHATVPPHQIHLQHGDSVMNLQFCTDMPYMVLLWDLLSPRWKHLQTSGPGRAINQHIRLILAFRRDATRRQGRPKEPNKEGNGGWGVARALFSAGYRVN